MRGEEVECRELSRGSWKRKQRLFFQPLTVFPLSKFLFLHTFCPEVTICGRQDIKVQLLTHHTFSVYASVQ